MEIRGLHIAVLFATTLLVASCARKEPPVTTPPGDPVFKVTGTLALGDVSEEIDLTPGLNDLYLYTWVEELGHNIWQTNCEIRSNACDDCGPAMGFSWFADSPLNELPSTLSVGDQSFFDGLVGEVEFDIETDGAEFIFISLNGDELDPGETSFVLSGVDELFDFDLEVSGIDFDGCLTSYNYLGAWYDPCEDFCLPTLEWDFGDDFIEIYPPAGIAGDTEVWWMVGDVPYVTLGDESITHFVDDEVELFISIEPWDFGECNFSSMEAIIPVGGDCSDFEFDFGVDPEPSLLENGIFLYYRNAQGDEFTSSGVCEDPWFWFSQSEDSFFEILEIQDYILNDDGIPTKQFSINVDCELIDEEFAPFEEPYSLELSGTIAFAFPD